MIITSTRWKKMETMSVRLDTQGLELYSRILKENKSEVIRELVKEGKKHKAVHLYKEKKVSLGLGAKLAGVTLSEFFDLLGEHNVDLNIEIEDVQESLKTLRNIWK